MKNARVAVARSFLALFTVGGFIAAQSVLSAAKADKVDLCHNAGNQKLNPISVSVNALEAHLAHGDVLQPNGLIPGTPGFVYDSGCRPVTWGYAVNVAPDATALTPAGNLLVGSGIPGTNFGTARNETAGIELGLMVLYRQGPTVISTDTYADGVLNFSVASGPQSTANGSSGNNATRAAWNFTFSVATGLNGAPTGLADYTFQLLYDVDPGPGTNFRTLTLEPGPGPSGFQWRDQGTGLVFIADDAGNSKVTQNSENYAFGFFQSFLTSPYGPGSAFAGPGAFDIILRALSGPQIIVSNRIVVNVAP